MPDSGIITLLSTHSLDETAHGLEEMLRNKGVKLFAIIDHSAEARSVDLTLRPIKLLIFGNPKAGTPVMAASPTAALDLPLKILVWEDDDHSVKVSCNTADYLQNRHNFPHNLVPNLAAAEALAEAAAAN